MHIWVVGKEGMLGSYFSKILKEQEISFYSTSKKEVDITDIASIKASIAQNNPTHIINCAAYTNVEKAEEEIEKAFSINGGGVENLALAASNCKLVHFSTDYIFDGAKKKPYVEEDLPSPLNVYGQSKLAGERALFKIKPDALVIRISWLYGGKTDFVAKMIDLFEKRNQLSIVSDQIGRPTYAKDVVLYTLASLEKSGLYHFAQEGEISWYEFAKEIFSIESRKKRFLCKKIEPIETKNFPTKAARPLYSVLGSSKMHSRTKKARPWQMALKEYLHG